MENILFQTMHSFGRHTVRKITHAIDQFHNATWLCTLAEVRTFKWQLFIKGMMNVAQILQGMFYDVTQFIWIILVFRIFATIHQQLVAMLRRHVRFVCRILEVLMSLSEKSAPACCDKNRKQNTTNRCPT